MNLNGIKLTWLGHATFHLQTPEGKTVLIDPWVMGNPMCPASEKDVKKVDIMLCTHGHGDHIGDAVEIAKRHKPSVIGIPELCGWLEKKGVQRTAMMNKGGTQTVGDIKVTMVHADHSCGIQDGDQLVYGDHFTMGPREAAYACKLLRPGAVIPMHFGTFPVLTGTPSELQKLAPDVEVVAMQPGMTIS
jgi:L-ascorbate metabolism protein UlaG (beta-lactamase superfamily)